MNTLGNVITLPIRTQKEVAAILGLHHDSVKRIERNAIKKLREHLEERGLTGQDVPGDRK